MKGIHKNNNINIGNVEMQRAAFQQAQSKKASLAKAAEESLKFNKLVDESKNKVTPRKEGETAGHPGQNPGDREKAPEDEAEKKEKDDPPPPSVSRIDIRI